MVVFPIGIPGMGKTHFAENAITEAFKELNLDETKNLHIIRNDHTRKVCLDEWLAENPRKSVADGMKATSQKHITMFFDQLNETLG